MPIRHENYGYPATWHDVAVHEAQSYASVMTDFHVHSYYEISLILEGEVTVRLSSGRAEGTEARLVLCAPGVPHVMTCTPGVLYRRINVSFSPTLTEGLPERDALLSSFGAGGCVLPLTAADAAALYAHVDRLRGEEEPFRRRLMLLYLLSLIAERRAATPAAASLPSFLEEALRYLHAHYAEHITAASLARRVGVSRTTLLVALRRYTDRTLLEHLTDMRLCAALPLLRRGCTERQIAAACGFSDASHFHTVWKKRFALTPREYLAQYGEEQKNDNNS